MRTQDTTTSPVAMPVGELRGRAVWNERGERLGTVRDVGTDDAGRIATLVVRERWMLGRQFELPAQDMRLDHGDVVLPAGVHRPAEDDEDGVVGVAPAPAAAPAGMPVLLAGRDGAKARFGGLDLLGSFFGALVMFASMVLVGGVLAAMFDTGVVEIDTSFASFDLITSGTMLVGAATLLIAGFLGGWAAGRSARLAGPANGMMSVVWLLGIGIVLAALGSWLDDPWNVYAGTDLPTIVNDDYALWGSVALGAALVLLVLGAALGGMLGESWHRRVDRAMLDVVAVGGATGGEVGATGQVGSPVAPQPLVADEAAFVDGVDPAPRRPGS